MVCGGCNRRAARLHRLRNKHPEVVKEWSALPEADWDAFAKITDGLSVEAMKDKMLLEVKQYKQLIEEQKAKTEKPWLPRSLLKAQGYDEAEIDSIVATCDKKWDSEINVLHITVIVIILHMAITFDFTIVIIIPSV